MLPKGKGKGKAESAGIDISWPPPAECRDARSIVIALRKIYFKFRLLFKQGERLIYLRWGTEVHGELWPKFVAGFEELSADECGFALFMALQIWQTREAICRQMQRSTRTREAICEHLASCRQLARSAHTRAEQRLEMELECIDVELGAAPVAEMERAWLEERASYPSYRSHRSLQSCPITLHGEATGPGCFKLACISLSGEVILDMLVCKADCKTLAELRSTLASIIAETEEKTVEKRIARDGNAYTFKEFEEWYSSGMSEKDHPAFERPYHNHLEPSNPARDAEWPLLPTSSKHTFSRGSDRARPSTNASTGMGTWMWEYAWKLPRTL